ncbi:hypothetical protein D3C72_1024410 [compost metagenome]
MQLGIGLGNFFGAITGLELAELLAGGAHLGLGLIPLGAGAVELTTGDGTSRRQRTLATPLLLCLEGGRLGGGQFGPCPIALFAAIPLVHQGVGRFDRGQIGAGAVALVGEGHGIETSQRLARLDDVPLIDQHLADPAADPERQVHIADVDVAVEDGAVGRAALPPEVATDDG